MGIGSPAAWNAIAAGVIRGSPAAWNAIAAGVIRGLFAEAAPLVFGGAVEGRAWRWTPSAPVAPRVARGRCASPGEPVRSDAGRRQPVLLGRGAGA
ncbi:hypothetical protein BJF90_25445 [Pseudonocardia sp. CNS-004]|nr:hypothetical protein BJF90_25445 [Pseudonocardia sp. CNS-004]